MNEGRPTGAMQELGKVLSSVSTCFLSSLSQPDSHNAGSSTHLIFTGMRSSSGMNDEHYMCGAVFWVSPLLLWTDRRPQHVPKRNGAVQLENMAQGSTKKTGLQV